jgi:hypothetical protein
MPSDASTFSYLYIKSCTYDSYTQVTSLCVGVIFHAMIRYLISVMAGAVLKEYSQYSGPPIYFGGDHVAQYIYICFRSYKFLWNVLVTLM